MAPLAKVVLVLSAVASSALAASPVQMVKRIPIPTITETTTTVTTVVATTTITQTDVQTETATTTVGPTATTYPAYGVTYKATSKSADILRFTASYEQSCKAVCTQAGSTPKINYAKGNGAGKLTVACICANQGRRSKQAFTYKANAKLAKSISAKLGAKTTVTSSSAAAKRSALAKRGPIITPTITITETSTVSSTETATAILQTTTTVTVTKTNQNPHPAPTKVYPVYGVTVDKKSTSSSLQKFTDGYKAACAATCQKAKSTPDILYVRQKGGDATKYEVACICKNNARRSKPAFSLNKAGDKAVSAKLGPKTMTTTTLA